MSELSSKLDSLRIQDYIEIPDFLSQSEVQEIKFQIEALKKNQEFRPARIGQEKILHSNIRSDQICWIDEKFLTIGSALEAYFTKLQELRHELNQRYFFGIEGIESHFAIYQAGEFYEKHFDVHRNQKNFVSQKESPRIFSLICYLNEGEGGELQLYFENELVKIKPQPGKLVGFLSQTTEHEVLVSQFERLSITSWFLRKPVIDLSL